MNINNLNHIHFGHIEKDPFYPNYSYQEFRDKYNLNTKLDILYAKSLEIEENQRIITQNQEALQKANQKALRIMAMPCNQLDINNTFNSNKINVIA